MSSKIIEPIIYFISVSLYFLLDNNILKIIFLFVLLSILIYRIIFQVLNKNSSIMYSFLYFTLLILFIVNYLYQPFTGKSMINDGEYISYTKLNNNKFNKLFERLSIYDNNGVKFIKLKDDSSFLIKKEYKKNIKINNIKINILKESSYKTGNYILYIKNNITNENQEYLISNSGSVKLSNGIKIELLNKSDNFKNAGKAIQIKYNFSQSQRSHKQWLYKDYKEFNLITASDDPLTILYVGDQVKKIYNTEISFIPPYQKQIFYLIILLSIVFLILQLLKEKNEN